MRELFYEKRKLIIAVALVLVVILAAALIFTVRASTRNTRYRNYMETAQEYLLLEKPESAIPYLERAYEIKDTDECAIELAKAYAQIGATREAEDLLMDKIDRKSVV